MTRDEDIIPALDVYDRDYPPGSEKRERMDAEIAASREKFGRRLKRRERLKALVDRLLRRRG